MHELNQLVPTLRSNSSSASLISVVAACNSAILSLLRGRRRKDLYKAMPPSGSTKAAWRICHSGSNVMLVFVLQRSECSAVLDQRDAVFEEEPNCCLCFVCWHSWVVYSTVGRISRAEAAFFARFLQQVSTWFVYVWCFAAWGVTCVVRWGGCYDCLPRAISLA